MLPKRVTAAARTATTRRLLATCLATVAGAGSLAAIALAAGAAGPQPPPTQLAVAVHDALGAPAVDGITARIEFTDKLVDSGSIQGSDPLLSGATGRLWIGSGRRFRLELQSERGDAQIVSDGTTLSLYDPSMRIAYRVALPTRGKPDTAETSQTVPTIAEIQQEIDKLVQHVTLSTALPSDVAGRAAYTVRVTPQRDGGLLGRAELAWDAARGVPLRAAVYAAGDATPVLELTATDISFGSVPASTFDVPAPAGVKVVEIRRPAMEPGRARPADRGTANSATGPDAVSRQLSFALSAPSTLAGMARAEVRLLDWGGKPAALITYGHGLGGLAVIEQGAEGSPTRVARPRREGPGLSLPTVDVGGVPGQELPTALGTMVRFARSGVQYTVAGSVRPTVAETAARGL